MAQTLASMHHLNEMYSNTVTLMQLIEQYSCFWFPKLLLDNYVSFLG